MLNPHASFDSFVVGSGNRLAATAARAVAEAPGSTYNPLFIYARPGLGKTHLLMAIGHEAIQFDPSRTVEYVTVDDFVEAYHAALAAGQADAYRRRFTEADLVLLDDAQLLADRRELQSELLRLIDVLSAADRQIVLAGDRPPEEIQRLDERLIREQLRVVEQYQVGLGEAPSIRVRLPRRQGRVIRLDEVVHRHVLDGARGVELDRLVTNGHQQVRLTKTWTSVDEQRVVGGPRCLRDCTRRGRGQAIARTDHERIERSVRIQHRRFSSVARVRARGDAS
jgi:hypothetical protein